MGVNIHFQDPENSIKSSVVEGDKHNFIPVRTEPYTQYLNRSLFFTNPRFGTDLAVDATSSGEPLEIYDGGDTTLWTPTAISGTWDFQSTDYAYEGTYSVDATGTKNNDTAQFSTDTIVDMTNYSTLVGYIYITTWQQQDTEDVELYFWDTATSSQVGNSVNISTYINEGLLGEWQSFTIPLVDMNAIGVEIDALRIRTVNIGGNPPNYYLDNIYLAGSEGNGPQQYFVKPDTGKVLWIKNIGVFMSREYSPVLTDSTIPNIPHKGFLGLSVNSGIVYQRKEDGVEQRSFNFKHLYEILLQSYSNITSKGYDGTYTWLKIDLEMGSPYRLSSITEDFLSFTLTEDFSSMDVFNVLVNAVEERE